MKTNQELLQMTHEELMSSTVEIRNAYKEAKHLDLTKKIEFGIASGYKHIQMEYGCIKVTKNKQGVFYSTRNGFGTGKNTYISTSLKDCIDHLKGLGWGKVVSYK